MAQKVGLSDSNKKYFGLFLRAEHDFGKISTALGSIVALSPAHSQFFNDTYIIESLKSGSGLGTWLALCYTHGYLVVHTNLHISRLHPAQNDERFSSLKISFYWEAKTFIISCPQKKKTNWEFPVFGHYHKLHALTVIFIYGLFQYHLVYFVHVQGIKWSDY